MIRLGRFFNVQANPIGVDFGRARLRMAQVGTREGKLQLLAAASTEVPPAVQSNPANAGAFYQQAIKELLDRGGFQGRQAILGAPAAITQFRHLLLSCAASEIDQVLRTEAADQLPIPPSQAAMRHLVAGEVRRDGTTRHEVIVMAMRRDLLNQLLAATAKARLDVKGMGVDPLAIINCFASSLGENASATAPRAYIDMGQTGIRVYIARGIDLRFARRLPVGARRIDSESSDPKSGLSEHAADSARAGATSTSATAVAPTERKQTFGAPARDRRRPGQQTHTDQSALTALARELDMCLRHHETSFPSESADRLIFLGGGARDRQLCRQLAESVGLPAHWENPLAQLDPAPGATIEINPAEPQPEWAVALGLTLGGPWAPAA